MIELDTLLHPEQRGKNQKRQPKIHHKFLQIPNIITNSVEFDQTKMKLKPELPKQRAKNRKRQPKFIQIKIKLKHRLSKQIAKNKKATKIHHKFLQISNKITNSI